MLAFMSHLGNSGDRFLENSYGYFRPSDGSFVITQVRTPRPWVNVLSNDRYGAVISQSGGGFSWLHNCQLFRLSRWDQDLVQSPHGRWIYVQDLDDPFDTWSTTYLPTRIRTAADLVEHGLGWSRFTRERVGIRTVQTQFVPEDLDGEIILVRVENRSNERRRVRLTSMIEWHLGEVGDWHREFHRLFMESQIHGDALLAWKHAGLPEHRRVDAQEPPHAVVRWVGGEAVGWITDKVAFLGPEGSIQSPDGLRTQNVKIPSERTPRWDDPIAAGIREVDLAPGEAQDLVLVIGAAASAAGALELAQRVSLHYAQASFVSTQRAWRERCRAYESNTGDPAIDALTGTWLPYQAIAGRMYARCAYYQQGGAYGYRDQLQDSLMFLIAEPDKTALQLGRHAEAMYEDGGVRHWWHPKTDLWPAMGPESWHSDTCLWLAYGTLAYLSETGDESVLDREFAYLSRDVDVPWVERIRGPLASSGPWSGTLLDHCLRGIDRSLSLRSERGLPLIGAGDWNDGLSHAGIDSRGESVWLAMFLFDILRKLVPVLRSLGRESLAVRYEAEAEAIRTAVETHAWDGEWYLGGTRDDGKPFGSRTCEEGKIFLNPQTWAVLSGLASPERAKQALESVKLHLLTDYGALLLQPAYTKVDRFIGYITRYAPGLRENGGVYSHASTWAIQAFASAGDLETARGIYRGMLPSLRSQADADLYAAEPYVMPGNADGPDSPYAGRAGWTWYTGSAAWMVRVAHQLSGSHRKS